jgi:histidinol-phosphatase (PHP family)
VTKVILVSVAVPLVDYHVHTARCGHASGAMERYVERAIEAGVAELGFSDHLFMYWLPPERRDPELTMAEWEHDFYIEDVERCRQRYRGEVKIRLATEADYIPGHELELERILRAYDWDYVIGSVHFIGEWGFDDSRYVSGFVHRDIDALYAEYFSLVGASAETGLFDTIGHSDLVKKFGHRPRADQSLAYAELAARLARTGVCAEVNTGGLRKPVGEAYPHPDLLRAYCLAGVPVTLGSDAHAPTEVAADFASACELSRQAGYAEFVKYEGRRRTEVRLPATVVARTLPKG